MPAFFSIPAHAQSTAFTYQGRLNHGPNPASGGYDLTFSLWTAASGPAQVGGNATPVGDTFGSGEGCLHVPDRVRQSLEK